MNIKALLAERVKQALSKIANSVSCKLQVRQSTKIYLGNYQIDGIMSAAKTLAISPQQLAKKIQNHLNIADIATKTEISGSGFINIFLNPLFITKNIDIALQSERLGVGQQQPQTIVVDYSAPNVAKEMHVGHLRSTIIGDAIVRTLEFLGHKVIRANHIGDWGTQFGMLIAYLKEQQQEHIDKIKLEDLENFYCTAKRRYDKDKFFAERARSYVVKLQNGDQHFLKLWKKLVDITMSHNQIIYDRLNISLTKDNIMGESLYNKMLPDIIADLKIKGLAVESKGALVVFLDEFKNKQNEPMGVIIQKKDGGYLYTTTDIACVKYRYETLHADRILYYIDSRQHQHLLQVWSIARKAGYIPDSVILEHHMFGMMLGKDGKPFKTRTGGTVKLSDLLYEALERAKYIFAKKNPNMPTDELNKLADVIGIGAIKYADLSKNRTTAYIFDWDSMLKFEGNTAPYMQYAYIRILSIFKKAKLDEHTLLNKKLIFTENREIRLAVQLLQFEETLDIVARNGTPHMMCSYLYGLAGLFSNFYEHCPILLSTNSLVRNSRLKLCLLTAKTLKLGLNTLGIDTIEYM